MRGLILVILAAFAATAAALASANQPSLNGSEQDLFDRLDRVLASGNPSSSDIVRAFGLPPECARTSCTFGQPEAVNPSFAAGDLRPSEDGLVFVLERATGQCIRVDRAVGHFGAGQPQQSCPHGGCWYASARHRWGILGFGLETPEATCVTSVVINSLSYQRPRDGEAR